ncbi:MAG: hypothetical protein JNK75_03035 [Betaproteobacteria bacterium]|nr:hypothetical protein [Betaproteobacteria bacterium]
MNHPIPTDFTPIEDHIRRARIDRAVYLSGLLVKGVMGTVALHRRGWHALADAANRALQPPAYYTTSLTRRTPQA